MKTFKFKDLAVTVNFDPNKITLCRITSPSLLCPNPTVFNCPGHSFCHWPTICPAFTCGGCSVIACSHLPSFIPTDFTIWKTGTPYQQVVDELEETELNEFKTNLAELQRYVDVKIQDAPNQLDMLEKKLQEAIEEVRAQRGNR
ncbi:MULTISPECIES: hypothetical protein [unclassified Dyadobacter]|jgi:hypothetical protein|uniref:hypothetical protein n=1 Tax=unclassified Dyadobacter TaxID=2625061 RepID=UPI001F33CE3C|nr:MULTISPECIES: hypothetical protein [unclassified Dyadobacter]MCE7073067.1 hypothetical protein [Dyadobacter sp. CY327]MCF2517615.1 hypothetical protein [Dyadobacter sp. CY351]